MSELNKDQPALANNRPIISIGLPVYNGENYIAQAINCVIKQTFTDWELIISDNASTDRTVNICRDFAKRDRRIRLYEQPRNMGVSPNYNEVFRLSRGLYFKWMAHDDLFSKKFLEVCLREIQGDEQVVLVFPILGFIDATGRRMGKQKKNLSILGITSKSRFIQLMKLAREGGDVFWVEYGLVRRKILEQTGLMGMYNGDDQVCLIEIALQGKIKQVNHEMFLRREHPASATMKKGWTAKERAVRMYAEDKRKFVFPYFRLIKEYLVCLVRSQIPIWGQIECLCAIILRFLPHWKDILLELISLPIDAEKVFRCTRSK